MSYKVEVPLRRVQPLMGTGYPRLSNTLRDYQKCRWISRAFESMHGVEYSSDSYGDGPDRQFAKIGNSRGPAAYNKLNEFEQWLKTVPRLGRFSPPRWWNRLTFSTPKGMVFCIDNVDPAEVLKFIQDKKVHHRQFQIFSKYDDDISIAFKSQEMSTMFKLQFAEKLY